MYEWIRESLGRDSVGLGVEHVLSEINLELSAFGFEVRKIKGFVRAYASIIVAMGW